MRIIVIFKVPHQFCSYNVSIRAYFNADISFILCWLNCLTQGKNNTNGNLYVHLFSSLFISMKFRTDINYTVFNTSAPFKVLKKQVPILLKKYNQKWPKAFFRLFVYKANLIHLHFTCGHYSRQIQNSISLFVQVHVNVREI